MNTPKTPKPAHKTALAQFAIRLLKYCASATAISIVLFFMLLLVFPDCACNEGSMDCRNCGGLGNPIAAFMLFAFFATGFLLFIGVPISLLIGAIWVRLRDQWEDTY
jgi:hypothetical protein